MENVKQTLIEHLKDCYIDNDIDKLWGETKSWFKSKLIEMGGSYASFGKEITVRVKINDDIITFKVSLKEVQ